MTTWPAWVTGPLLIVALPALTIAVQVMLRRRYTPLREGDHNDVAGFIIAVVGVIYAVLLAFVVIVGWENFSRAEGVVGQEASALRTVYRDSGAFPAEVRDQLREDVRLYAGAVIEHEWPAMARDEPGAPEVIRVLDHLAERLATLPADTPSQVAYLAVEADRFNELVSARSTRLDFLEQGVPGVLWVALVVGAVVTIGFAMIFSLRSTMLHTLMTGSLSALIGVLLFVSVSIDHPFAGNVHIEPAPLERVLVDFGAA